MSPKISKELCKYRIEQAKENIEEAKINHVIQYISHKKILNT